MIAHMSAVVLAFVATSPRPPSILRIHGVVATATYANRGAAVPSDGGDDGEPSTIKLVTLQCPPEFSATEISDSLMEAGALYVSVSDSNRGTPSEQPIFVAHPPGSDGRIATAVSDEPNPESWDELLRARRLWTNATLEVGFAPSADVSKAIYSVVTDAGLKVPPRYTIEELAPMDWVTEVQSNWPPIALKGCLTIRFPWHTDDEVTAVTPEADSGVPSLLLNPGIAFGTGEHATTQLCCAALRRLLTPSASSLHGCAVLDYGSGSGVLSFAALLFGAGSALGVDIDVEALATSRVNAAMNGFNERQFVAVEPDEEQVSHGDSKYPIVVANILAGTLIELSGLIASRVAPGGTLLMSGIWEKEQVQNVLEAYEAEGLVVDVAGGAVQYAADGAGWALIEAKAPATASSRTTSSQSEDIKGPPPPGFDWGGMY